MMEGVLFYLFALTLVFGAVFCLTARRPVGAVLALIWCFFNAACLFLGLGAEFLAFVLLIVYIGAVAVLFLFVVMMLEVKGEAPSPRFKKAWPLGLGLGGLILAQLIWAFRQGPQIAEKATGLDVQALGKVLYTDYALPFQICGLVLLVAIVGAIFLTLEPARRFKRQKTWEQLAPSREDVVTLGKVEKGKGAS